MKNINNTYKGIMALALTITSIIGILGGFGAFNPLKASAYTQAQWTDGNGLPNPVATDLDAITTNDTSSENNNLWNWSNMYSLMQDTYSTNIYNRVLRGNTSTLYFSNHVRGTRNAGYGFRPVLEVLDTDTLIAGRKTGDKVKFGTLFMDNTKQLMPTNPVSAGNIFSYNGSNIEIKDTDSLDEYKLQWIYVRDGNKNLLVGDRNIVNNLSWTDLNNQNLLFGKNVTIDGGTYKIRAMTGGTVALNGTVGNYNSSTTNEWDRIISKQYVIDESTPLIDGLTIAINVVITAETTKNRNDMDKATALVNALDESTDKVNLMTRLNALTITNAGIWTNGSALPIPTAKDLDDIKSNDVGSRSNELWHWKDLYSWMKETYSPNTANRVIRGGSSINYLNNSISSVGYTNFGFRPVLEVSDNDILIAGRKTGDKLRFGTLYLDNFKQAMPTNPVYYGNVLNFNSTNIAIRDTDGDNAFKLQWIYVRDGNKNLLICDRAIVSSVTWTNLNTQGLIAGKNISIEGGTYKIRVMTGGTISTNGSFGNFKASTTNEWDRIISRQYELDESIIRPDLINSTSAVVKAEYSKAQIDVDTAIILINALPDGTDKSNLTTRLGIVQAFIQSEIGKITTSVIKAEVSQRQSDLDSARVLVNTLTKNTIEWTTLNSRLDTLQIAIDNPSITATLEINDTLSTEIIIENPEVIVNTITFNSTALLNKVENIVSVAEQLKTIGAIDKANYYINTLNNSTQKTNFQVRISKVN